MVRIIHIKNQLRSLENLLFDVHYEFYENFVFRPTHKAIILKFELNYYKNRFGDRTIERAKYWCVGERGEEYVAHFLPNKN